MSPRRLDGTRVAVGATVGVTVGVKLGDAPARSAEGDVRRVWLVRLVRRRGAARAKPTSSVIAAAACLAQSKH